MERQLDKCDALQRRKIEVINFGVSGYGTGQELITLQKRAWQYNPDIVLLAFLTGNDFRDNTFALGRSPDRYCYSLNHGNLVLGMPRSRATSGVRQLLGVTISDFLLDHSRVVQLAMHYRSLNQKAALLKALSSDSIEAGLDNQIYREPQGSAWRSVWEITETVIWAMK